MRNRLVSPADSVPGKQPWLEEATALHDAARRAPGRHSTMAAPSSPYSMHAMHLCDSLAAASPARAAAARAFSRSAARSAARAPRVRCPRRYRPAAEAAAQDAAAAGAAPPPPSRQQLPQTDVALDDRLSSRPLELDAAGYFIIRVDREAGELVADFYTNVINEQGLACDPATGEVISCKPGAVRLPARCWRGRTAKAVAVEILEKDHGFRPVTHLEHAAYLGRELQRAELALAMGLEYVQD